MSLPNPDERTQNMKTGAVIAIAAVLVVAAFAGGWFIGSSGDSMTLEPGAGGASMGSGRLSPEDAAAVQNMSPEERQAFMQEQLGSETPAGARPGGAGGLRGGALEGEVIELAEETVTIALADGGSQTIYIDDETVIAYEEDTAATAIAEGTSVMLFGMPEADGVMTATMLIVIE